MNRPSLPEATILYVEGFGQALKTKGSYFLDFIEEGSGVVQISNARSGAMAFSFDPGYLIMNVSNGSIQSGGGFIGGGFGLEGAGMGMLEGALLNKLTTRNKHFGMLSLVLNPPGLTPRVVVLGYQRIPDSEILNRIRPALSRFMDYWIEQFLLRAEGADDASRIATIPGMDEMAMRGWFSQEQFERVVAGLQPKMQIVATVESEIDAPTISDNSSGSSETVTQLQQLSALHASGALTDDEFVAAKARILAAPQK
jgi:hypothetical protein